MHVTEDLRTKDRSTERLHCNMTKYNRQKLQRLYPIQPESPRDSQNFQYHRIDNTSELVVPIMSADTNTHVQPPFPGSLNEDPKPPIIEACMDWTNVTIPNSTTFDPSGASKLSYYASTSITCDKPENAHFRFSLHLIGSNSPGNIKNPGKSQTFVAYTSR